MNIPVQNKKIRKDVLRENITGFLFITPAVLFFTIFTLFPIIMALVFSFMRYNGISVCEWYGFKNFINVFKDKEYWQTFANIAVFVILYVPLSLFFPLLLAVLLDKNVVCNKLFRALYYIPCLTSAIAAGLVFRYLFNPSYGLINNILGVIHITGPAWLEAPPTAMICVVIMSVWMVAGSNMIIYFSAMRGLPLELFESAKIDGASDIRIFWEIKFPLLRPTTFFVLTMSLIGAFQLYDQVLILTNGNHNTMTPVFMIYNTAFKSGRQFGKASAQAVVLFAVIMIVTQITQRFVKETY